MTNQDLHKFYNATSTETEPGSDKLESYESWLERQLISRINQIEILKEACKTVAEGYEADGMEGMEYRDNLFYVTCKNALKTPF